MKEFLNEELIVGMQKELHKYAADQAQPDLTKAAECLHAALEILEEQGLHGQADQLLQVLQKIAQSKKTKSTIKMPSVEALMRAGLTKHDLVSFQNGDPKSVAKFNLVLRRLGMTESEIFYLLGVKGVMSEDTARDLLNPNRSLGKINDWIQNPTMPIDSMHPDPAGGEETDLMRQFKADPLSVTTPKPQTIEIESLDPEYREMKLAQHKPKGDRHTKGLTPEKQIANLKNHGTQFNLSDDSLSALDVPPRRSKLSKDDMEADFADLLNTPTFDMDASDDELLGMEIKEDSLEVFDEPAAMSDFEDERD